MAITYPLSLPSSPTFRTSAWTPRSSVGVSESPWSFAQQTQVHGGRRWEVSVELPPMLRADAAEWQAFLLKLNGRQGTFLLGDPAATALRGAGGGTPVVAGANAVGATSLNVRGLADVVSVWLAGDFISVGSGINTRLHMVLGTVNGNVGSPSGEAAVDIWPSLRAALSDGAAIAVASCKGTFRLADNAMPWTIDEMRVYGFSFNAVEAL